MEKRGLDSRVWRVVKDTPQNMELVHRYSDKTMRVIPKGGDPVCRTES